MESSILKLIEADRVDVELLEDTDDKVCAVNYFNCLADSLDVFDDKAWNKKEGYKTPNFPSLTNGLEGWDSGLYVFAAMANVGKSALMLNVMEDLCMNPDNKLFGLYFSLDDNKNKLLPRIVAMRERLPISLISKPGRYQKMVDECHPDAIHIAQQLDKRKQGIERLKSESNKMMVVDNLDVKNWNDIKEMANKVYNYVKALDEDMNIVVAIDSLADIELGDGIKLTENERIDAISKAAKDLSTELDIIVMGSMHLRKLNGNRRPTTEDLKMSNRLEYEADVIWLLYNDVSRNKEAAKIYSRGSDESAPKQPVLELDWAKNKISSYKGRTFCYFSPEYSKAIECHEDDAKRFNALVYQI